MSAQLTADIKKTYPQLGDVTADYAWAGTLGLTLHRMPQIGELGPGVWLASGFGGHGLNTTAMAGNIIARAIVEGDETWRQFTPFELVWAGGVFGRAAAQARVWIKRLRDRFEERRAKARELAHRQAREAEIDRAARQVRRHRSRRLAERERGGKRRQLRHLDLAPREEPVTATSPLSPHPATRKLPGDRSCRSAKRRCQPAEAQAPSRERENHAGGEADQGAKP